jgi:hypothetical protein
MKPAFLQEVGDIIVGGVPTDVEAGALTGDRVNLKHYKRCTIVVVGEPGAAGEDPTLSLQQHDAATAGNSKALVAIPRIYEKVGADLGAVTSWTIVDQTAAATYVNAASGEAQKIFVIEADADELDVANGYVWVSLNIADVGTGATGQLVAVLYLLWKPRYPAEQPKNAVA